jgi:uncharacterized membrane protein
MLHTKQKNTMKKNYAEKHSRSLIKSISYRILSITADSIAAYFFTHDVALSAGIVIVVNAYSTILYYFHERAWANIHWGRTKNESLSA